MAEGDGGNPASSTLSIKIKPTLDIDALASQIKEALVKAGLNLPVKTEGHAQAQAQGQAQGQRKGGTGSKDPPSTKDKTVSAIRAVGSVAKVGFDIAQKTFNGILGIIKDIHNRVKQSSAFLATVENLFNLAMTLLLMPLGNAIADVILPKTIDLVDGVLGLWDEFEKYTGKGDLKSIVGIVMNEGIKLIGEYLNDIGNIFIDTGDNLLGSIGHLFNWLGTWLENGKLVGVLNTLFDIFKVFAENLNIWIPLIIGYQIAQIGATIGAAAGPIWAMAGAAAGFGTGFSAGALILNSADGGEIPHTSGGQLVRVAEHENEVIVPKSKIQNMGGNTYYYTVNGYTTEEVKQLIRDYISSEISNSQYRSGL